MTALASLVANYADARDLGPRTERDEVHVITVSEHDDHHRLVASVRRAGPGGAYVAVDVRSQQRVAKEQWAQARTSCNLWNARMRLPKAWLDADLSGTQADAHVVLEGCVPEATLSQAMFDGLADSVIVGTRKFWRWVDVHAGW